MKVVLTIKDDIYPKSELTINRFGARGIIVDEQDKVAILRIKCDDIFGHRDHFELPGGGQEGNETMIETLIREIKEEVGVTISDPIPLGIVEYEYNLLKRTEHGHYFLARKDKIISRELTEFEASIFLDLVWIQIDELIDRLKHEKVDNVGKLIHKRDLYMLEVANKIIKKEVK